MCVLVVEWTSICPSVISLPAATATRNISLYLRVEVSTTCDNVVHISWVTSASQWGILLPAYMAFGPSNVHYISLSLSLHRNSIAAVGINIPLCAVQLMSVLTSAHCDLCAQIPRRVTSPECVLWQHWWQLGLTGLHSHLSLFLSLAARVWSSLFGHVPLSLP